MFYVLLAITVLSYVAVFNKLYLQQSKYGRLADQAFEAGRSEEVVQGFEQKRRKNLIWLFVTIFSFVPILMIIGKIG